MQSPHAARYSIKYPTGRPTLVIQAVLWIVLLVLVPLGGSMSAWLHILQISLIAGGVVHALVELLRSTRKLPGLEAQEGMLRIGGHTIQAGDIRDILVMGYLRPTVGIRPAGRKVVPHRLCFRFAEKEDQSLTELAEWAERNRVKMTEQSFMRWW